MKNIIQVYHTGPAKSNTVKAMSRTATVDALTRVRPVNFCSLEVDRIVYNFC